MFEQFPYANFHELNMDWIVKIAKDFLDQYTHIQETITTGLESLDSKATELEGLLQAWYDTHSQDIAQQLSTSLTQFITLAEQKTAESIASIPEDYTALSNTVTDLKRNMELISEPTRNIISGMVADKMIEANGTYWNSPTTDVFYAPVTAGKTYYVLVTDVSGLVCAFYVNEPVTSAESYNSSRIVQNTYFVTAPITGYMAVRATKNTDIMIIESNTASAYIPPRSAIDVVSREDSATNRSMIDSMNNVLASGNVFNPANAVDGYMVSGATGTTLQITANPDMCYFSLPVHGVDGRLSISIYNFPVWALGDAFGALVRESDNKIYLALYGSRQPIETFAYSGSWTMDNTDMILYVNCTIAEKERFAVYVNEKITQYTPYGKSALSVKNSPLYGKSLACNGDSIMYGAGFTGGFASVLAEKYNMDLQNIAVSGGTIASGTMDGSTQRHWIAATMQNLNDSDYIIIEGGLNDYSLNVPLFPSGQSTPRTNISSTPPSDLTIFSEAMEMVCYNLVTAHTEKKKCFIIPHKISWMDWTSNSNGNTYLQFKNAQKEILKKWGIPYLDLSEIAGMDTVINAIASKYTANSDRTHPNVEGYWKFYLPHIEKFLEQL